MQHKRSLVNKVAVHLIAQPIVYIAKFSFASWLCASHRWM